MEVKDGQLRGTAECGMFYGFLQIARYIFFPQVLVSFLCFLPHSSPSLTFPGFGEGQQAGGRKTKCSAGEEFFHTLNWPLILASRLEMCEPVCLGSRCS